MTSITTGTDTAEACPRMLRMSVIDNVIHGYFRVVRPESLGHNEPPTPISARRAAAHVLDRVAFSCRPTSQCGRRLTTSRPTRVTGWSVTLIKTS